MPGSDTSLFKHARAASTVWVDQVPRGGLSYLASDWNVVIVELARVTGGREVVELFRNFIGPLRNVEFFENGSSMEITFSNPDATTKALCMSGYVISGHPIIVTAGSHPNHRAVTQAKSPDTRRNLYVLGLPFDLSTTELLSIFSQFGTVTHSVILATVDNASRRRGFVVMSTHAEAKAAMDNISQTNIRGSIVDVSWAVVQRSLGFLDGGDRAVNLESQVDSSPSSSDCGDTPALQTSNALYDCPTRANSLSGAQPGLTSIIVHNLPAVLFVQDSDLEPLFFPFGEVKEIQKQDRSPASQSRADMISVLVTYSSFTGAREAKLALHGQTYGDTPLVVEFFPLFRVHESDWKPGRGHLSRSSLNPRASPFVINTGLAVSAPPTYRVSFSEPSSNGLATPSDYFLFQGPISRGYRSLPTSSLPSRSNSTASGSSPPARSTFYA